jgi:hypothetical protein
MMKMSHLQTDFRESSTIQNSPERGGNRNFVDSMSMVMGGPVAKQQ